MDSITIRIAMLNAEVPVPSVLPQRGSYGNMFYTLLRAAANRISPMVNIEATEYDVRKGEYPSDLSLVDALLITGSASSAYDSEPWILQLDRYILDTYTNHPRVKMFGSCFGHQIICQSLLKTYGARVEKDPKGYETGVHAITLTDEFQEALKKSSNQCALTLGTIPALSVQKARLQFVHGDHVRFPSPHVLPISWTNVGSTQHCAVQGVYQAGRVFTLQGHFEFDRFVNSETLKYFAGTLNWTPELLQSYLELVDADDDSKWAAEFVVRFFLEKSGVQTKVASDTVTGLLTPPLEAQ